MSYTTTRQAPVTAINCALKQLQRPERLIRGRGYYYVTDAEVCFSTSLHVFQLERMPTHLLLAVQHVEAVLSESCFREFVYGE